jgi:cathepsin D
MRNIIAMLLGAVNSKSVSLDLKVGPKFKAGEIM